MIRLRHLIFALLLLLTTTMVSAQTGQGQLCLRAFEDRNANGIQDPGEPLITRGISAELQDSAGVTIRSALMDDSPQAAQGVLCFQQLAPGQYSLVVVSADYNATTAQAFIAQVTDSSIPQVFAYGGQLVTIAAPLPTDDTVLTAAEQRALIERLFFAGLGAALVVGGMIVLGVIIYAIFIRPRIRRAAVAAPATGAYPSARATTGSMPAVRPDTGSSRPIQPGTGDTPTPGMEPAIDPEDTDRFKPPRD